MAWRRRPRAFIRAMLFAAAVLAGCSEPGATSGNATSNASAPIGESETTNDSASVVISPSSAIEPATTEVAAEPATTEVAAEPATTESATTEMDEPTRASSTTSAPLQPELEISLTELPMTAYDVPSEFEVDHVVVGDVHTVVAGRNVERGSFLGRIDQLESTASVAEILRLDPGTTTTPTISSIVWFQGRFFAFTMWDPTARPANPTVLTSADGVSWTVERMATMADAGLFLTPDSPSDAQHAGVVDAAVVIVDREQRRIVATGWALHRGEVGAMFWETTDGETWKAVPLPNQRFDREVGTHVASSPAGQMVRLGGPIHTGVGAVVRHRSTDDWEAVPVTENGFIAAVAANNLYLYALEGSGEDGRLRQILWREANETAWTAERLPAPLTDGGPNLVLEASSWHDPVLIERSGPRGVVMWTLDRQRWSATQLEGDHLISATANHVVTRADEQVLIYDRRVG